MGSTSLDAHTHTHTHTLISMWHRDMNGLHWMHTLTHTHTHTHHWCAMMPNHHFIGCTHKIESGAPKVSMWHRDMNGLHWMIGGDMNGLHSALHWMHTLAHTHTSLVRNEAHSSLHWMEYRLNCTSLLQNIVSFIGLTKAL